MMSTGMHDQTPLPESLPIEDEHARYIRQSFVNQHNSIQESLCLPVMDEHPSLDDTEMSIFRL